MQVLYDHSTFEDQKFGGISKYFVNLISQLATYPGFNYNIPLRYSSNAYISQLSNIRLAGGSDYYSDFMFGTEFKGKWTLYQLLSRFNNKARENLDATLKCLKSEEFDLFHPTDYAEYFLTEIGSKPFVITVHDLIDEIFPEYRFHVHHQYRYSLRKLILQKSAAIIAISHSTKADLLKFYDVDENKVHVIYHGYDLPEDPYHALLPAPSLPDQYILYSGKRVHYKNFYFFIASLKDVFQIHKSLKIVCCGAPFNAQEKAFFTDLGVSDRLLCYQVEESQLPVFYQNAAMLAYPSLHEGFGLPILEAFNNKCPVVLSDISVFKEIADGAAMYFDPKDKISIGNTIMKVIEDETLRAQLKAKGSLRAKMFSLEKLAQETYRIYQGVVK